MSETNDRLEFTLRHDAHPLRIETTPGIGRCLVVSFTSVGQERDQWPPREFVGLASQQGKNHVMCITDISRCWMNNTDMVELVTSQISDYVMEHGITEMMAIGTSMGAYNALVIGRTLPFSRIVCFTPQYSVHPDVMPDEKRWWYFRKQIQNWPNKQMDKLPNPPVPIYMFHGDTPDERMHWERFPKAENLRHFIFSGADHNFVRKLKSANVLRKIVTAALNNRPVRLGKVVRRAGGMWRENYADFALAEAHFARRPKRKRPASIDQN